MVFYRFSETGTPGSYGMVQVASDGFTEASEDLGFPDVFRLQPKSLQMRPVVHVHAFATPGSG